MLKIKQGGIVPILIVALAVFSILFTLGQLDKKQQRIPLSQRIPNNDEIVQAVRKGLREHSRQITITFSFNKDVLNELTSLTGEWMEEALQETDDPTEGDYIRYQYGGYDSVCRYENKEEEVYTYTVTITPRYYTYLAQEEEVTEQLTALMRNFDFDENTTDLEKVTAIYSYICENVRYDTVHIKHPTATLRSTAYSALIWHTATCQGYSVLLYRMLRMAGLKARVVTGYTEEDAYHAWNIVELYGQYYQLDATWDAGKEEYSCFLKGTNAFTGHVIDSSLLEDSHKMYPLAQHDFSEKEGVDNIGNY